MSAKDNLNPRLFDLPEPQVTDVSDWAQNDVNTMWHVSDEERLPSKSRDENPIWKRLYTAQHGHPYGFHAGTAWAAVERGKSMGRPHIHPVSVSGETALTPDGYPEWTDDAANGRDEAATAAARSGKNVFYENESEDRGSISVRSPRENLTTWSQDVVQNPQDASYAERAAVRKGAELVYSRAGIYKSLHEKWNSEDDGDPPPAGKIPLGPGLVGSEVDVEPEGEKAFSGPWERLVPSLVYPKKKRTQRKPPQEETLF